MLKHVSILILVLCLGTIQVFLGCGGSTVPQQTDIVDLTTLPEDQLIEMHQKKPGDATKLPRWVLEPPPDTDEFWYTVASGESRRENLAQQKAEQNARAAMALKLEAAVTVLVKSFEEEVGGDPETAEANALFAQISKSVADQTLRGTSAGKTFPVYDGRTVTKYVLMEMQIGNVGVAAVDTITKDQAMYQRWRASEGFQDLEKAVQGLRADKKSQDQFGASEQKAQQTGESNASPTQ